MVVILCECKEHTDQSIKLKHLSPPQLRVLNEGEVVEGCPVKVRALPDVSKIMFSGIDPCALGSIVEVVVSVPR